MIDQNDLGNGPLDTYNPISPNEQVLIGLRYFAMQCVALQVFTEESGDAQLTTIGVNA